MTESHDWWSHLNPFEKSRINLEEKTIDKKTIMIALLRKRKGTAKTREKLELEIAGHRFYRQQLVNRGTQRAKLGIGPKKTLRDRAMTHVNSDIARRA